MADCVLAGGFRPMVGMQAMVGAWRHAGIVVGGLG